MLCSPQVYWSSITIWCCYNTINYIPYPVAFIPCDLPIPYMEARTFPHFALPFIPSSSNHQVNFFLKRWTEIDLIGGNGKLGGVILETIVMSTGPSQRE